MIIQITSLTKDKFPFHGKLKNETKHKYHHAKIENTSGSRAYLTVYVDIGEFKDVPYTEIAKRMYFENGDIYIIDDYKNKVIIGTYQTA
jgi:hypothetical protein